MILGGPVLLGTDAAAPSPAEVEPVTTAAPSLVVVDPVAVVAPSPVEVKSAAAAAPPPAEVEPTAAAPSPAEDNPVAAAPLSPVVVGPAAAAAPSPAAAALSLADVEPVAAAPSPAQVEPAAATVPSSAEVELAVVAAPSPAEVEPAAVAAPSPAEVEPAAVAAPSPAEVEPVAAAAAPSLVEAEPAATTQIHQNSQATDVLPPAETSAWSPTLEAMWTTKDRNVPAAPTGAPQEDIPSPSQQSSSKKSVEFMAKITKKTLQVLPTPLAGKSRQRTRTLAAPPRRSHCIARAEPESPGVVAPSRAKKKVMRALNVIGDSEGIDQEALDEYGRMFTCSSSLAATHVQAIWLWLLFSDGQHQMIKRRAQCGCNLCWVSSMSFG